MPRALQKYTVHILSVPYTLEYNALKSLELRSLPYISPLQDYT